MESNLVKNFIPQPEEFHKPSRRNTHIIRLYTFPHGILLMLPLSLSQEKPHHLKKLGLPQLAKLDAY